MFVAVNGCLESSPEIRQVWGPFTLPFSSYKGIVTQTISPNGSVYSPLISTSHSLVAATARASAISLSSYLDVRLYLDDRGMLRLRQPTSCVLEEVHGEFRPAQTSSVVFAYER